MPAGKGTYGSKRGRPPKKNGKAKADLSLALGVPYKILEQKPRKGRPSTSRKERRGFGNLLGAPSEILIQKPRKKKKPDSKNIIQKPRKPGTSKTKNAKPMTPVTSGNGTKGKLTAAQKTLPEFLKKKIKGAKKKK